MTILKLKFHLDRDKILNLIDYCGEELGTELNFQYTKTDHFMRIDHSFKATLATLATLATPILRYNDTSKKLYFDSKFLNQKRLIEEIETYFLFYPIIK